MISNPLVLIILCSIFLILNVITIPHILRNKNLSKREKTNYIYLQFGMPIIGTIIYFSSKSSKTKT